MLLCSLSFSLFLQWWEFSHEAGCVSAEAGQRSDSRTHQEPGDTMQKLLFFLFNRSLYPHHLWLQAAALFIWSHRPLVDKVGADCLVMVFLGLTPCSPSPGSLRAQRRLLSLCESICQQLRLGRRAVSNRRRHWRLSRVWRRISQRPVSPGGGGLRAGGGESWGHLHVSATRWRSAWIKLSGLILSPSLWNLPDVRDFILKDSALFKTWF